ncbi:MAG: hypothetical protein AAF645_23170, partial [Myxococcota bacterium]
DEGLIAQTTPSAPLSAEVATLRVGRSETRGAGVGADGNSVNTLRLVSLDTPPRTSTEDFDRNSPFAVAPADDGGAFAVYRPFGAGCDFVMCRFGDCVGGGLCAADDASIGDAVSGPSMVVSGSFVFAAWLDVDEDPNGACASGVTSEVTLAMGRTNVTPAGRPRAIVSLGTATPVARPVLLPSRSVAAAGDALALTVLGADVVLYRISDMADTLEVREIGRHTFAADVSRLGAASLRVDAERPELGLVVGVAATVGCGGQNDAFFSSFRVTDTSVESSEDEPLSDPANVAVGVAIGATQQPPLFHAGWTVEGANEVRLRRYGLDGVGSRSVDDLTPDSVVDGNFRFDFAPEGSRLRLWLREPLNSAPIEEVLISCAE